MKSVLAWNLGLLFVAVVGAELVFGGWLDAFSNPSLWRLSIYRNVDWRLDAGNRYPRSSLIQYRRDGFALRGNYGRPEDVSLLVLGGSTTDERFISEGETWTDLLATCLRDRGRNLVVANAGVAGQSSRGHILNYDLWLDHVPGLKPSRTLVYLGINEQALAGRSSEDDVRRYSETGHAAWFERLKLNSALYSLAKTVHGNWLAWKAGVHDAAMAKAVTGGSFATDLLAREVAAKAGQWTQVNTSGYEQRLALAEQSIADELRAYDGRLDQLLARIRKSGSQPILITQAAGMYRQVGDRINGDLDNYFVLTAFNRRTMQACARHGLDCIDLAAAIRFTDGDHYDNVHTTPTGSRKVAEVVCAALSGGNGASR